MFAQIAPGETPGWSYFTGPWFCREMEETDLDKDASFFREHRRSDFSDVVHAKKLSTGVKRSPLLFLDRRGPTTTRQLRSTKYMRFLTAWDDTFTWNQFYQADGIPAEWAGMAVVQCDGRLAICVCDSGNAYSKPYYSDWMAGGSIDIYLGKYVSDRSNTRIDVREFVNIRQAEYHVDKDGHVTFNGSVPDWLRVVVNYCHHGSPGYGNYMSIMQRVCRELLSNLETEALIGRMSDYQSWSKTYYDPSSTRWDRGVFSPLDGEMKPSFAFKLHEPEVILDGYDDIMFGRGTEAYWRNYLIEKAYLAAVQSIPRMSDNNISNMLEIASFIKSLVIDHKVEIPKSLNDYWLSYRYSYSTSKMDAEDAIKFMHRYRDLGQWSSLKCRGMSDHVLEDGTKVRCRCTLEITPKELTLLAKVWKSLYTFGLTPSFYVIWDMIPYSFIVDWLIPVGDIVASWDTEREFTANYDIKSLIFSLSYDARSSDIYMCHYYSRWLAKTPPQLHGYYFFEDDPSSATVGKRILDTIALTVHLPLPLP
jgi:hypothetical protein